MVKSVQVIDRNEQISPIQFDDRPFASGGEADLYFSPDKRLVIKLYQPDIHKSAKMLFEILRVMPDPAMDFAKHLAWPQGLIPDANTRGRIAGIVMPNVQYDCWLEELMWYRSVSTTMALAANRRGTFEGRVKAAICMAMAVRGLNFSGYGHGDLNPRNFLINPVDGKAVLLDLDGLVVPEYMTGAVMGMPGYMAPELEIALRHNQILAPTARSDRHALAVNLYQLLLMQHPLLGGRRKPLSLNAEEDDRLQAGEFALYKEHPTDSSNRPAGDYLSAALLGLELQELFRRSFVDGLHDPQKRPAPFEYEDALKHLLTDLVRCQRTDCIWGQFPSLQGRATKCPMCDTPTPPPPVIGSARVLFQGPAGFYSLRSERRVQIRAGQPLNKGDVFGSGVQNAQSPVLQITFGTDGWSVELMDPSETVVLVRPGKGRLEKLEVSRPRTNLENDCRFFVGQHRQILLDDLTRGRA